MRPGYKQTQIGIIPKTWEAVALGEIGEPLIGLTYDPEDIRTDGTLVLRSSNIDDGKLRFDDVVCVSSTVPERIMVRKDDILICVRNGSRNLIGKCALLDERAQGMTFGAFMSVLRTPHARFVYHQLQSQVVRKQIDNHLGATINQITNSSLKSFVIPFPDTECERSTIASALGDVDALISSLDKLIAKKRDIKQAAMQQLLTGKRRLPGFDGKWDTRKLGELVFCHREQVIPSTFGDRVFVHFSLPAFDAGKVPIVEPGSAIGSSKFAVPVGAILISKLNPRIPRVWAPEDIPVDSVASTEFIVMLARETIAREFLFLACSSPAFQEQMALLTTGTTRSHQRVRPDYVLGIELSIPADIIEQRAIASVLSDIDAEIEALERRRDKTRLLKHGMMQELLTGRVRLV